LETSFKEKQERLNIFQRLLRRNNTPAIPKEVPDNVLKKCSSCNASVMNTELKSNLFVCPQCGNHFKIGAVERINQIIDAGTFKEFYKSSTSRNLEDFPEYSEKLDRAKSATGLREAVVCGVGSVNGIKVAIAVMDSNFMMGSMGSIVGEKITRTIEFATRCKIPLIISCTSGGARMQEGIISLMQMTKTSSALKRFSDAGGLYISILTHPTTGGVSASFAMLGDIIVAEPNALIGFAGSRVIEKTINEVLPPDFQRSEFLLEKGFVDMIVDRRNMKKTLHDLIAIHVNK
jgi:acetyl-CoA carboxylase, carboxyl transferase, beta subunit